MNIKELINQIQFNQQGLIPVITQDIKSNEVLMMAWMNEEALLRTLKTKQVCYWSRSRKAFWVKGETSGHVQKLISCRIDCDFDTLLLQVEQTGAACHTGEKTCFFQDITA